jgi:hypothetical protein
MSSNAFTPTVIAMPISSFAFVIGTAAGVFTKQFPILVKVSED